MKNRPYTKKGSLGQDFPSVWFAETSALDKNAAAYRANACSNSSGNCLIVSVKIPEYEKHLTPLPRHKADKIQI